MLIDFGYLWNKYKVNATGVLHIGASHGEEAAAYCNNGIVRTIWVEAIPEVFEKLVHHIAGFPGSVAFNACVSNKDGEEVIFHVSSNEGQSSSFLELGTHKVAHPDVSYIRDIKMTTKRVISLFKENNLDPREYTFLNIDLQGAELLALKGMNGMLKFIDYAYLEVNKAHLYVGCPLVGEIDEYMGLFDFVRVETLWAGNTGWGDCFMIKRNLLPNDVIPKHG